MKRLLLTGGSGFVGANIIRELAGSWEVHAVDTAAVDTVAEGSVYRHALDLTDPDGVRRLFDETRPEAVIHTAAISDIDWCEANKEVALAVNVGATRLLAELCRAAGAKMVYFSSDSVFDGAKGGYTEEDTPSPLNVYARTKVEGESAVKTSVPEWVIVRPSLVMGLPVGEEGNSFLWRMIVSLKKGETVSFPSNETRTPVDVITLSRAVIELATGAQTGIFHLAGNDAMTRFDMAKRICERLGYASDRVVDKKPVITTGRAGRPADASLSNEKAKRLLKTPMRDFADALALVIENRGKKEL